MHDGTTEGARSDWLAFGPFRLDLAADQLLQRDQRVHLTPKALALLRLFASRPGELVTKRELFTRLWAGTAVTDDALSRCIRELLRLLLARESLELMRLFLRLLRHVALRLTTRRARLAHLAQAVGLPARAIVFLLLARRELTKFFQRLVNLVVGLLLLLVLLLAALHGLVLIAQLVLLQLKDVGQFNNGASLTKASAGTLTIAGTNTYTGSTEINTGTLAVTGSLLSTGAVNVNTSATLAGTLSGTGSVGNVTVAGPVSATSFTGNGSGLSSLNATQLNAGTLNDSRLSANVALRSGGNTFSGSAADTNSGRLSRMPTISSPSRRAPIVQAATCALISPISTSGMRTFCRSIAISVSFSTSPRRNCSSGMRIPS
jgi:autotransporter-associated beta strand protein